MTKQQLIGLLSADLARERFHLAFYLRAASVVRGLHREELSEFFMKQAASEMDHVKEFQNLLLELGGEVTDTWDFSLADRPGGLMASSDYPENILEFALKMEDEVVEEYVARMEDAAKVGGAYFGSTNICRTNIRALELGMRVGDGKQCGGSASNE